MIRLRLFDDGKRVDIGSPPITGLLAALLGLEWDFASECWTIEVDDIGAAIEKLTITEKELLVRRVAYDGLVDWEIELVEAGG